MARLVSLLCSALAISVQPGRASWLPSTHCIFQTDPNSKRLEEVVKKLEKISSGVGNFLRFLENTKLEINVWSGDALYVGLPDNGDLGF